MVDDRPRPEKIFAMLDSPEEAMQLAAVRAMKRVGMKFRDLVKPEIKPLGANMTARQPAWTDVEPSTDRARVDLVAYGKFDREHLLRALETHLVDANCVVHKWNVETVCRETGRGGCLHYQSPGDRYGDPWQSLRLPAEPKSQLPHVFDLIRRSYAERMIFLADVYADDWYQRSLFRLLGIKIFAIHVGDGSNRALRKLARTTSGLFGWIPDASLADHPLDVRALLKFVDAR